MNKNVFCAYVKFFSALIVCVLVVILLYATIAGLEIPVFLCVIDVVGAFVVCVALSYFAGKSTRIIKQVVSEKDLPALENYLFQKHFVPNGEGEYVCGKAPSYLFKNVVVKVTGQECEILVQIPYYLRDWNCYKLDSK